MKVLKRSIIQTSRTCPSSWKAETSEGTEITISFRTGRLDLLIGSHREFRTGRPDQFDVTSMMALDEAISLLEKEGIEFE